MATTQSPTPTAPVEDEDQDWLDHLVGRIKRRPVYLLPVVAVVIAALVIVNNVLNPSQPIGTDPTVAGRPLSNPGQHLHSLAMDPLHPNVVYLGSHYGLFVSHDGGKTWPQRRGALNTLMIISLAASPLGEGLGVIGVDANGGDFGHNGVYFSYDQGATLTRAPDPPGVPAGTARYRVAPGPAGAHDWLVIYVNIGVFETTNDGHTWRLIAPATSNLEAQRALWAIPGTSTILLGTSGHLYASFDDGAHWQTSSEIPTGVYDIAASAAAPQTIIASADSGIYRSTDGGHHFSQISGPVGGAPLTPLVISAQQPQMLYGLGGGAGAGQLFRSNDGGQTWTALPPLQTANPFVFMVATDNDQHLLMGFYSPAAAIQSFNGGQTWSVLTSQ